MVKEWYIWINGAEEGPYSIQDLKNYRNLTPDTLVWKKGFKAWVSMRSVPELKEVFKDKPPSQPLHQKKTTEVSAELLQKQATLTLMQPDPLYWLWWLLLAAALFFYFGYQFFHK